MDGCLRGSLVIGDGISLGRISWRYDIGTGNCCGYRLSSGKLIGYVGIDMFLYRTVVDARVYQGENDLRGTIPLSGGASAAGARSTA